MTNKRKALVALVAAISISLTGFVATSSSAAAGFVGVILPDAASSARWETADRPFLNAAFKSAGVAVDIQNANGDKAQFATIAEQMITKGAKVLIMVNLDSDSAKAVQESSSSRCKDN
jgi:D-xylose transport system substrate-binding protein